MHSPSMQSRPAMSETDPLLGSGSYIDPAPAERKDEDTGVKFVPGVAIDAKPISMCRQDEGTMGGVDVQTPRRRSAEEKAKKPSWLPEGWTIELKTRNSGATAGQVDVYYVEPSGQKKCRSKNEVFRFLETGSKHDQKRKSAPGSETKSSSGTPSTRKQRKYKEKGDESSVKSATPLNSDTNADANGAS